MTRRADMRRDEGFSLSELIVVLGLIGFVLAAIYGATYAMMQAGGQAEAQATFARESGEPMRIIGKAVMQSVAIEVAEPYKMTVRTDTRMDALDQRVTVTAGAGGNLQFQEWQLDAARTVVGQMRNVSFSQHCSNVERGIPLFRYYDAAGDEITDLEAVASDARKIRMSLALRYEGIDFTADQWIFLRNKY